MGRFGSKSQDLAVRVTPKRGLILLASLLLLGGCAPAPPEPPPPIKEPRIPESFEMAQRARFVQGNEWELDVMRYAHSGNIITVNAGSDLEWSRDQLDLKLESPGVPPLLVHISMRFVYDSDGRIDFPAWAFWYRYNQVMLPHAYRAGATPDGAPVRDPLFPVGWVLDPRTDPYTTMLEFFTDEWGDEFLDDQGRFGVYFDCFTDLYGPMMGRIGVTGQEFLEMRAAFREGRSRLARELRLRFGSTIYLVANWGKDEDIEKIDVFKTLDGICVEGPLTLARRNILFAQYEACEARGVFCYSTAWNDEPSDLIPYPVVRAGSHWMVRNRRGEI